jgi:hypothetical protein
MTDPVRKHCAEILQLWDADCDLDSAMEHLRGLIAQPEPAGEAALGPSIEDVGPLISWLTEQAYQAADADQPVNAGMLTWAAQVIGKCVDEDATLAQPAPPAEGEVGEPSDENCWQWYTYCPEEGVELYGNKEQAKSAAEGIMGSYQKSAHSDGWHEDMESVSWGKLVPFEQAQVIERRQAEPGGMWDEWVEYKLRATRQARPATEESSVAQPAEGEAQP